MKKLLFATFLLFSTVLTFSQWISNYGDLGRDVNFTNAKGSAVTTDANGYSYVTGYTYDQATQNDIITIKYTPAGDTVWVKTYNGNANRNDEGKGIFVDNYGNVYVVGFAEYTSKSTDVVVLKYSANGQLIWEKPYSLSLTALYDEGSAIAADAAGNIYITGFTTNQSDGKTDIFTRKYDPSGNALWTSFEDGSTHLDAQGLGITVSNSGNVYVTGYITANTGNTDIAILKYNSDGRSEWFKTAAGTTGGEDKAWGIVVDESDNVYIGGYVTNSTGTDCYTAKYNSAGLLVWSKTYNGGGNQGDKAWGIVVDTDGSVFITGETTDASLNINYITIKYSSAGDIIWQTPYNGPGNGEDKASSIGLLLNNDNSRSIIVTGKSWGSSQNFDYATVRYSASAGSQSQVNRYTFSGTSNDVAKDLAITPSKKVVITGFSQLTIEAPQEQSVISTVSLDFSSVLNSESGLPTGFLLYQNYPNPFNPSTTIKFDLEYATIVKITVYDMLGREAEVLINQHLEAGTHNISFSAGELSSGIYFYELSAGSYREIKKMTLIK